jgi:hypothetical protein
MPWPLYSVLLVLPSLAIFICKFYISLVNVVGDPLRLRNPALTTAVLGVQLPPPAGYTARISVFFKYYQK